MGDQYYTNKNRNRFYDKGRLYDRNRSYNRNNQNCRGRKTFEMIGIEVNIIEVIEETLRTETGHMREVGAGIETKEEDFVGIEETGDLEIEVDPYIGIKVKEEDIVTVGSQGIYKGVSEKEKVSS